MRPYTKKIRILIKNQGLQKQELKTKKKGVGMYNIAINYVINLSWEILRTTTTTSLAVRVEKWRKLAQGTSYNSKKRIMNKCLA